MKKVFALLLALAMMFAMAAGALAEDISLRVWVGDNADTDWINGVIDNFKAAYPDDNYTIEVGIISEGNCASEVLKDTEGAADVFTFADDQFNSLYLAGALMQVVEDPETIIAQNAEGAVAAATDAQGDLYAYPATPDNGDFMFYSSVCSNFSNAFVS